MRASTARYPYIPVVSYRVAARDEQSDGLNGNRGLVWNISGSVPSAAALAVGMLAFSSSGDLQSESLPRTISAQATAVGQANAWLASAPHKKVQSTEFTARVRVQSSEPIAVLAAVQAVPERQLHLSPPTPKIVQELRPASRPTFEFSAEAVVPPPAFDPYPDHLVEAYSTTGSEIVRRDYSKTVRIAAEAPVQLHVDTPVATIQQVNRVAAIRDRLASLKHRAETLEESNPAPSAASADGATDASQTLRGQIAESDLILDDAGMSAVKLGALLTIVKAKMERADYEALSGSVNAHAFVDSAQIENAGMQADYDTEKGEIILSLAH